jgi:ATP-dependent RNA helicase DeaD
MTFDNFAFSDNLQAAIQKAGFVEATPIQEHAIPVLLQGHNVIGLAQTGTGKTAAYGLPLIEKLQLQNKIQALVVVPTRELATQVAQQLQDLAPEYRVVAVFGGQPFPVQLTALRRGAQVIVGTPGRILDHLRRQTVRLNDVRYCVLDEADEMLDFGFQEEMEGILTQLPQQDQLPEGEAVQMALFSATMSDRVQALSKKYLKNAQRIEIEAKSRTVDRIEQSFCLVHAAKKVEVLGRILDYDGAARAESGGVVVFCRTRAECQEVSDTLRQRNYLAEALHGDMAQSERDRVMERFRRGQCRLLVATDVAARGLDVDNISHVVNFSIPRDIDQYIHRVGRTARAGRSGQAVNLVTPREQRHVEWLEKMSGAPIRFRPIPSVDDLRAGQVVRFQKLIEAQMEDENCQSQLGFANKLAKKFGFEALAAGLLQSLWDRLGFDIPKTANELEELGPTPRSGRSNAPGQRNDRNAPRQGDRPQAGGPRGREPKPFGNDRPKAGFPARDDQPKRNQRPGKFERNGAGERPAQTQTHDAGPARPFPDKRERPEARRPRDQEPMRETFVEASDIQAAQSTAERPKRRKEEPKAAPAANPNRDRVWLKFSVGNREGLNSGDLVNALTESGHLGKDDIYNVVIEDRKSLIEIPSAKGPDTVRNLKRFMLGGKRTKVDFML